MINFQDQALVGRGRGNMPYDMYDRCFVCGTDIYLRDDHAIYNGAVHCVPCILKLHGRKPEQPEEKPEAKAEAKQTQTTFGNYARKGGG